MFLIPKCKSVSRMQTAFCSYQERTKESGSSFTEHPNASASATATWIDVYKRQGETDEYETDITDKRELQIRDAMGDIPVSYTHLDSSMFAVFFNVCLITLSSP